MDGFPEKAGSAQSRDVGKEKLKAIGCQREAKDHWLPKRRFQLWGENGCSGRCSVRGDPESLRGQKRGKRPTKYAGE